MGFHPEKQPKLSDARGSGGSDMLRERAWDFVQKVVVTTLFLDAMDRLVVENSVQLERVFGTLPFSLNHTQ